MEAQARCMGDDQQRVLEASELSPRDMREWLDSKGIFDDALSL